MVVRLKKPTEVEVPKVVSLGSKSLTITGTEQSLVEQPGGCPSKISGYIDLSNLGAGDTVVISMYVKVKQDAWRLYHQDSYTGPVFPPIVHVVERPENHGLRVTIQQTAGIPKVIDYEFYQEA